MVNFGFYGIQGVRTFNYSNWRVSSKMNNRTAEKLRSKGMNEEAMYILSLRTNE